MLKSWSYLESSPALAQEIGLLYLRKIRRTKTLRRIALFSALFTCGLQILYGLASPGSETTSPSTVSHAADPAIKQALTIRNLSQNAPDATKSESKPGERLEYVLVSLNTGNEQRDFNLSLDLNSTLRYGSINDSGGGTLDTNSNLMSWGLIGLAPGQSDSRRVVVQLDEPFVFPTGTKAEPGSYNCLMEVAFGNSLKVPLACPLSKSIQQVLLSLPSMSFISQTIFTTCIFVVCLILYMREVSQNNNLKSESIGWLKKSIASPELGRKLLSVLTLVGDVAELSILNAYSMALGSSLSFLGLGILALYASIGSFTLTGFEPIALFLLGWAGGIVIVAAKAVKRSTSVARHAVS